jgi:hypothetical protein
MIATALIERCLRVLMSAACRVFGVAERVCGEGPRGAVAEYRNDEKGCNQAPQHW